MNFVKRFKVASASKVRLKDIDPGFKDHHESHKEAAEEIEQIPDEVARSARVVLRRWTVLPPDLPARDGHGGQGRDD